MGSIRAGLALADTLLRSIPDSGVAPSRAAVLRLGDHQLRSQLLIGWRCKEMLMHTGSTGLAAPQQSLY